MSARKRTRAASADSLLRKAWVPVFSSAVPLAVVLAVLAAAVRGIGMLGPRSAYAILPAGFVAMALTPWIFFHQPGRRRSGLARPTSPAWLPTIFFLLWRQDQSAPAEG